MSDAWKKQPEEMDAEKASGYLSDVIGWLSDRPTGITSEQMEELASAAVEINDLAEKLAEDCKQPHDLDCPRRTYPASPKGMHGCFGCREEGWEPPPPDEEWWTGRGDFGHYKSAVHIAVVGERGLAKTLCGETDQGTELVPSKQEVSCAHCLAIERGHDEDCPRRNGHERSGTTSCSLCTVEAGWLYWHVTPDAKRLVRKVRADGDGYSLVEMLLDPSVRVIVPNDSLGFHSKPPKAAKE